MRHIALVCIFLFSLFFPSMSHSACGAASWYKYGKITANGEPFRPNSLTAAHKSLPFGTRLKVFYGKKAVVVRINDRGPYKKGRILDLSLAAATALGIKDQGVAVVCYHVM